MALKDLVVNPKTVKFGQGDVTLYPLTLKDIIMLSREFAPELSKMLSGEAVDYAQLISQSPMFVASIITHSAREHEAIDVVGSLPFSVQLVVLQTIWDLSAADGDLLGKLILRLAEGMQKLNKQLSERNTALSNEIEGSHGKPISS